MLYGLLLSCLISSCVDEKPVVDVADGYITITGLQTRSYDGSFAGDGIDHQIATVRILAFDQSSGACKGNGIYYGAALLEEKLLFEIKKGTYNFVFLVNEPSTFQSTLNNLTSYSQLQAMSYPADCFTSTRLIPMIAEHDNVEILGEGKIKINNGEPVSLLTANIRRLAARVDVVLKSRIDLGEAGAEGSVFNGVTFSNLPDRVPLVYGLPSSPLSGSWEYSVPSTDYIEETIERNVVRKFTLKENSEFFEVNSSGLLTQEDKDNGLVWAAKVKRVILPSSYFATKSAADNAILFTVDLIDKYSPFCKLEIEKSNYTLPANAKLDLYGVIKEPLEMTIVPSDWGKAGNDWEIGGSRVLNVSHTSASITDFNGVRISFHSNMPRVRVLEACKKSGSSAVTNTEFNDLAKPTLNADGTYSTTRFYYDPKTGEGYMDVLVDGGRKEVAPADQTGVYTLTLSADNGKGGNVLNREITINVTQLGYRFYNSNWLGTRQYMGVFFRNNELGERVITGQMYLQSDWENGTGWQESYANTRPFWEVTVPDAYKEWIVLSSTPSFDPNIGTDNPGDPEKYPVVPNIQKGEDGSMVKGKGRLYFRVGMKKTNPNPAGADGIVKPNYFYLNLTYYYSIGNNKTVTHKIYVRQGEGADYVYENNEVIEKNSSVLEKYQPLIGQPRTKAVRFSPYNLTTPSLKAGSTLAFERINEDSRGVFTEYPSQAGAYFQWGLRLFESGSTYETNIRPYYRRGYHPNSTAIYNNKDNWASSEHTPDKLYPDGTFSWYIMWGDVAQEAPRPHGEVFETCPTGYRRPTDGITTDTVANETYDDLKESEMRQSLFRYPYSGDSNANSDTTRITIEDKYVAGTYPPGDSGRKSQKGTARSFYADGFFDRRPIRKSSGYGVALTTSQVAYEGLLFFNEKTNASLFFPHTGRIDNAKGAYDGRGSTGYYWTSTATPIRTGDAYIIKDKDGNVTANKSSTNGAWSFELQYSFLMPRSTYADFGESIRCVKIEE